MRIPRTAPRSMALAEHAALRRRVLAARMMVERVSAGRAQGRGKRLRASSPRRGDWRHSVFVLWTLDSS